MAIQFSNSSFFGLKISGTNIFHQLPVDVRPDFLFKVLSKSRLDFPAGAPRDR